ncbi:MAG: TolC family protein [Coxiellaceae bacterium]|nr:TolC family protein [Coxiellaceae bacterium]
MRRLLVHYFLLATSLCTPVFASLDLPPPSAPTTPVPATALPMPAAPPTLAPNLVDDRVNGDAVAGYRMRRLAERDQSASYNHPYQPVIDANVMQLPTPTRLPGKPRHLSLNEAIAIALRNNPATKIAELQRILDKFGLETSIHDRYAPIWNPLVLSGLTQSGATPTPAWGVGGGVAVTGMAGTKVGVTYSNNLLNNPGIGVLSITQPLLQGFGKQFNEITYDNAMDAEAIAKLNFKNSVINVVISVIANYRSLVEAYQNLALSKESLKSQEQSVAQTKIQVTVGRMAQSDFVQQQATVESTRLSVVQQQIALQDAYQAFLTALGLVPSANIVIDQTVDIGNKEETIPSQERCVAIALKNNIAYQTALIQLRSTERSLITAENNKKWQLGVTGSIGLGTQSTASGGTPTVPYESNPQLSVNLSIPIDNVDLQSAVVNAKVQIENAKLNLEQTKENLVRQVINQWLTVQNAYQQIHVAKVALDMQVKTLNNTKLQLKYGKSSVFEETTLETNVLQQQTSYVATEISYLNAVTALNQTLALTLDNRHVKLRY